MKEQYMLLRTTLALFIFTGLATACAAPQSQRNADQELPAPQRIQTSDEAVKIEPETEKNIPETEKNINDKPDARTPNSALTPSSVTPINPDTAETGGPVIVPLSDLGIEIPKTTRESLAKQWTLTSNAVHPTKAVLTLYPITQGDMGQVDIQGSSPFEGKIAYWTYRDDQRILFFDQGKNLVWTAHQFGPNMFQARYGNSTRYRLTPTHP
jgi:hypothetical protein